MAGFMFRAGDTSYRFFMVAISDEVVAAQKLRAQLGDDPVLEHRPLSPQVFEFVGMKDGDIKEWKVG